MLVKAVKWIVYSNIWVGISVVSFVLYCVQLGCFKFDLPYVLIAFFATLFAYNFQRLIKSRANNPSPSERHIWIDENQRTIQVITLLSGFVGGAIALNYLSGALLLGSIPFVIIVLMYAGNKWLKYSLRHIPYLKIVAISMVWSVVVYLFPMVHESGTFYTLDLVFFTNVFLFTFALCLPFDIRDLKSDKGKVKTIPAAVGVMPTKLLSVCCLLIVAVSSFIFAWYTLGIVSLVSFVPVLLTNEKRGELFFTGGIDGLFILLPVVHFLLF